MSQSNIETASHLLVLARQQHVQGNNQEAFQLTMEAFENLESDGTETASDIDLSNSVRQALAGVVEENDLDDVEEDFDAELSSDDAIDDADLLEESNDVETASELSGFKANLASL